MAGRTHVQYIILKVDFLQLHCYLFRAKSVFEITAQLEEMFLTRPVEEWEEEIDALDVPPIVEGMCAFFATGLSLFLEGEELTQATEFFLELIG